MSFLCPDSVYTFLAFPLLLAVLEEAAFLEEDAFLEAAVVVFLDLVVVAVFLDLVVLVAVFFLAGVAFFLAGVADLALDLAEEAEEEEEEEEDDLALEEEEVGFCYDSTQDRDQAWGQTSSYVCGAGSGDCQLW